MLHLRDNGGMILPEIKRIFRFEYMPGKTIQSVEQRMDTIRILFTDGITEAHEGNHKLFGLDRLCEAVSRESSTVEGVVENVFAAVTAYTTVRRDDQSLMVIEYA